MFLFPYLAHVPVYEMVAAYEKPELLLIYTPGCPYCKQVLDYLKKTQMTIPMCNVQEDKACRAKLINQGGVAQVPCLFINDRPLYESVEIIRWLQTNAEMIKSLPR
jgi:glutaredoxin 3